LNSIIVVECSVIDLINEQKERIQIDIRTELFTVNIINMISNIVNFVDFAICDVTLVRSRFFELNGYVIKTLPE
jgi:hypothetical protein